MAWEYTSSRVWVCPSPMEWGTLILEYGDSPISEFGIPGMWGCPIPMVWGALFPG